MNILTAASVEPVPPPDTVVAACARLLDEAYAEIARGDSGVADAVWRICYGLASIRACASRAEWKSCVALCRQHPLLPILHQDPYAARAFNKPRGYPGDAGTIDYPYRVAPTDAERANLTTIGQLLLQATTSMPSRIAVRERKRLAAMEVDAVAARTERPTVVALAAGHLREAACSGALRRGAVGRFVAIDQDQTSLNTIQTDYGELGVECLALRVMDLLQGPPPLANADLIYALGLYDYLNDSIARRLTAALVGMLAPSGRLLIANFMPGIAEAGYMEAICDWYLTYRSLLELEALADRTADFANCRREVWTDYLGYVAYMRITRTDDA